MTSVEEERTLLINKINTKLLSKKTNRQRSMVKLRLLSNMASELGIDSYLFNIRKLNLEEINKVRKLVK